MNLTETIESAELRFKQIIEEFFISVYDEKYLSSHGIDHHRRVWNYAKELYLLLEDHCKPQFVCNPSDLIIASYLHDIGMSVETGPRHGKHSRELCNQFLASNNLKVSDFQDVLETIENHDNKDYISSAGKTGLLNILSVADDLDAFGFIGIFRYSEIYLKRGIPPPELGKLITDNASRRFDNFVNIFGFSKTLVQKHRERFDRLIGFFTEYRKQIDSEKFNTDPPTGCYGAIKLLTDQSEKGKDIKDICLRPEEYSDDPVIIWFFKGLAEEMQLVNTSK